MDKRLVVIDEAQKFLLAAENLATASQDLTSMLQVLQSKRTERRLFWTNVCMSLASLNSTTF